MQCLILTLRRGNSYEATVYTIYIQYTQYSHGISLNSLSVLLMDSQQCASINTTQCLNTSSAALSTTEGVQKYTGNRISPYVQYSRNFSASLPERCTVNQMSAIGSSLANLPFIALETKTTKYAGNTNQLASERLRRDLEIAERIGDKSITDYSWQMDNNLSVPSSKHNWCSMETLGCKG